MNLFLRMSWCEMRKCFAFHSSSCLHWKPFCCARNSQENMRRLESKTFTYFTEDHQRYVLFHWCKKGSVACREGNYFYLLVIAVKISIKLVLWGKWCKRLIWIENLKPPWLIRSWHILSYLYFGKSKKLVFGNTSELNYSINVSPRWFR